MVADFIIEIDQPVVGVRASTGAIDASHSLFGRTSRAASTIASSIITLSTIAGIGSIMVATTTGTTGTLLNKFKRRDTDTTSDEPEMAGQTEMSSECLTESQMEELRQVVDLLRSERDGISDQEMGEMLESLGYGRITQQELNNLLDEFNIHVSSTTTLKASIDEWRGEQCPTEEMERHLRAVFAVFDRDRDGFISSRELREVMCSWGEELSELEAAEMIREADVDGDGRVSFSEFALMVREVIQPDDGELIGGDNK